MAATATALRQKNSDCDWGQFDSAAYQQHNYATLRGDDARILGIVRDWFRTAVPAGTRLHGIDVGTGSNLYPALALAPHCEWITLSEYSTANVTWLHETLEHIPDEWKPYWSVLNERGDLVDWDLAKSEIASTTAVQQRSIFRLPLERWDIGTMAFVADCLTADPAEFEQALGCFLGALKPGAPFVAAFMENSHGYRVGDTWFPAVPLTGPMVGAALTRSGAADGFIVHRVDIDPAPIRAGYSGYLVATGRSRGTV